MSTGRSVAGWLGHVLAWVVILLAACVLAVGVLIPRVAGAQPYTVLTSSMTPDLPPGTLVVVKPVDAADLRVGDVVTYQLRSGDPEVVTHRIRQVNAVVDGTVSFQTRGDANDVADRDAVRPVQIKGKLWYAVPFLGRANLLLTGRQHQLLVYVAATVLLGYALVMFYGAARGAIRRQGADA